MDLWSDRYADTSILSTSSESYVLSCICGVTGLIEIGNTGPRPWSVQGQSLRPWPD